MIALYVHPKNSNHLRSHSRAIMALDHSRLGLENKFSENKSGPIFCVRQVYNLFYKILLTSLGTYKPTFYTFYTSSKVKHCSYHTDLGQITILQYKLYSFNIQVDRSTRGLSPKPLKKFLKSPIRLAGSHFWQAPKSTV